MRKVLSKVLSRIRPSEKERRDVKSIVKRYVKHLDGVLTEADVVVGGSIAKDTWLTNVKDADLFVRFPQAYRDNDLSDMLEQVLDEGGITHERIHGSRDYFHVHDSGFLLEIIPIVYIEAAPEAQNITDISPLHVAWVKRHPDMVDDIRLAKTFAKAQDIYGAESYIQGFSGYCLEILTIVAGGFWELLEWAASWQERKIIDPEGMHSDVMRELNESKLNSPLILIDPVEAGRNVAAAMSREKYDTFRTAASAFVQEPSESFFKPRDHSDDAIRRTAGKNDAFVVEVETEKRKPDVVGCRILKIFERIQKLLSLHGFTLIDKGWHFDGETHGRLWFIVKKETLPPTYERMGPPLKEEKAAAQFREKHPEAYVHGKRLYAKISRDIRAPADLFDRLREDSVITSRGQIDVSHLTP